MPARTAKHVSDMEIDEISLVDRPANQHALVTIAKRRAPEEDVMPDEVYYDAQGEEVDPSQLKFGDHVFDADGTEYVLEEDDDEDLADEERELEAAGVSKAFEDTAVSELGASLLEELSKAVTESDKNEVIAKALAQTAALSKRLHEAEEIAKSERTMRLQKEYISKAAEYNVPVAPEDLGPVLMRMAVDENGNAWPEGSQHYRDCAVIHKALTAAGNMLFEEAGYDGNADNDDPMMVIDQIIAESVSKSQGEVSKFAATEQFFMDHPEAYDAYKQDMKG